MALAAMSKAKRTILIRQQSYASPEAVRTSLMEGLEVNTCHWTTGKELLLGDSWWLVLVASRSCWKRG